MKKNIQPQSEMISKVNDNKQSNSMNHDLAESLEKYLQWAENKGELVTLSGFPF